MRISRIVIRFATLIILTVISPGPCIDAQDKYKDDADRQRKQRDFDQPDEEEDLNRELWEFARKTPFSEILPYVAAAQRASKARENTYNELPNGWRIVPAGRQIAVGRLPYQAIKFAGRLVVLDTGYYYQEPQEVSIVDIDSGQTVKTLKLKSLFPSAEIGFDGDLYISGGFEQKVFRLNRNFEVIREYELQGFAGGLAPLDSKHLAIGYLAAKNEKGDYISGQIAVLNTVTGKIENNSSIGYFPYGVRYLRGKIYLTLLGENRLLILNKRLKVLKSLATGRTPQEMCTDGSRLYVVNTTSDNLSIVDLKSDRLLSNIAVAAAGSAFGRSPTSCAVEGNNLFVSLADINAVAVLDKRSGKQLGLIPAGWYPTKVLADNQRLLILNAKGVLPRRPNPQGPQPVGPPSQLNYVLTLLRGSVSIIPRSEIGAKLPAWTNQVAAGSPLFSPKEGFKLPIRYVFYIIKENRTYDQVLGDLARGNGDPNLTLFGKEITPIHHQLATEFVTLDSFFANGEISVLGHSFTTSGYASPFLEWLGNMSYSQRWKGYPYGTVPAVTSPSYLWDALDQKGIDYRIYGENYFLFTRAFRIFAETYGPESALAKKFYDKSMAIAAISDRGNEFYQLAREHYGKANTPEDAYRLLSQPSFTRPFSNFLTGDDSLVLALQKDTRIRKKFADYLYHYPFNYRSWDLNHSDLARAQSWITDFQMQLKMNRVAPFQYIWLPNDHTDGSSDRIHNPFEFVAQNDAALGKIVETISHSPIWQESLILIEEDDAQNGPDHVDATRTVALAVGPYVKRAAVVSDRYDQLSVLRTIELLLGLQPLSLGDRLAVPIFGIFTDKPDYRPFVATKPSSRLAVADRELYKQFARP